MSARKRAKRLTKKERRVLSPRPQQQQPAASTGLKHIHCVGCGRHIEPTEFSLAPSTATYITCLHGAQFPSCVSCVMRSQMLIDVHDRTGQPVKAAQAWH